MVTEEELRLEVIGLLEEYSLKEKMGPAAYGFHIPEIGFYVYQNYSERTAGLLMRSLRQYIESTVSPEQTNTLVWRKIPAKDGDLEGKYSARLAIVPMDLTEVSLYVEAPQEIAPAAQGIRFEPIGA